MPTADNNAASPGPALWIEGRVTTTGAIIGGAFLLLKTYAVAHFSVTTTLGLIAAAPGSVVIGSLAFYIYPLMPLVVFGLFSQLIRTVLKRNRNWLATATMLSGGLALAVLFSPWIYLRVVTLLVLGLAATVGLGFLGVRLWRKENPPSLLIYSRVLSRASMFVVVGVVVVAVSATADTMWLPAEVLTFQGDGPTIGYVLNQNGTQTTFLRASDRALVRSPGSPDTSHVRALAGINSGTIPTSLVTGRRICHWITPIPYDQGPVISLIRHQAYSSPNLLCSRILCRIHLVDSSMPLNTEPAIVDEIKKIPGCESYGQ